MGLNESRSTVEMRIPRTKSQGTCRSWVEKEKRLKEWNTIRMTILEYFKKKGFVVAQRSNEVRKVCISFGFEKVMMNLASEGLLEMEGRWNWSKMVQKRGSGNREYRHFFFFFKILCPNMDWRHEVVNEGLSGNSQNISELMHLLCVLSGMI